MIRSNCDTIQVDFSLDPTLQGQQLKQFLLFISDVILVVVPKWHGPFLKYVSCRVHCYPLLWTDDLPHTVVGAP